VATLANGMTNPGAHTAVFDAKGLPGGVYYCRLRSGHFCQLKPMMLMK
jgi:hypothetical protein